MMQDRKDADYAPHSAAHNLLVLNVQGVTNEYLWSMRETFSCIACKRIIEREIERRARAADRQAGAR